MAGSSRSQTTLRAYVAALHAGGAVPTDRVGMVLATWWLAVDTGAWQALEEAHEQAPETADKDTEETEQAPAQAPERARPRGPDSAASPRARASAEAPVAGKKTKKQAKPDPFYREKREFAALQAQRAAEQAVR